MDISKATRGCRNPKLSIWECFYREKVNSLNKSLHHISYRTDIKIVEAIKSHFPNATIHRWGKIYYLVKLKNADFYIQDYSNNRYGIFFKGSVEIIYGSFQKMLGDMAEIDHLMPKWEKEFADILVQYKAKIDKAQRRFEKELSFEYIINKRIENFMLEYRQSLNEISKLDKIAGSIDLKNIKVINGYICYESTNPFSLTSAVSLVKNQYFSYYHYRHCPYGYYLTDISLEQLQQIDKLIPLWTEEAKEIMYEKIKEKKSQEVCVLSIEALIKQKMKLLYCDYQIIENEKSLTLLIELKGIRTLKFCFRFYKKISTIINHLNRIEKIVNKLIKGKNNIRIYP